MGGTHGGKGNEIRERVRLPAWPLCGESPRGEEMLWEWLCPQGVLRMAVLTSGTVKGEEGQKLGWKLL